MVFLAFLSIGESETFWRFGTILFVLKAICVASGGGGDGGGGGSRGGGGGDGEAVTFFDVGSTLIAAPRLLQSLTKFGINFSKVP